MLHSYMYLFWLAVVAYGDDVQHCTSPQQNSTSRLYMGHCYEFELHHKRDWNAAQTDCHSKGGTLVAINNMDEQTFLMAALKSLGLHGTGAWIGLSDKNQEGTFTWVTGETSTFTYWAPGQPHSSHRRFLLDSVSDEDCVLLKYSDSGHWHDYPCEKLDPFGLVRERFPYICEYSYSGTSTSTAAPSVVSTVAPSTVLVTTTPLPETPSIPTL
uniref:Lectin BRA-3-like n=1 Tax=Crassostrea virginica TaxID=6565 RepID=A0A8B8EMX2_CRAVI|nr:lectin BRA-3-like [Crassostrea virginica]